MDQAIIANGGGEPTNSGDGLTTVELALLNDRRQTILTYLAEQGGEVDLSSLALHLAADEDEKLSAVIGELHDNHLPRLAANDLIKHQSSDDVILLIDPGHAKALVDRVGTN